jgi:hypothetical protein
MPAAFFFAIGRSSMTDDSLPSGFAETPEWLAFDVDPRDWSVPLLRMSEADYRAAAFLDQRSLRPDSELRTTSWTALAAAAGGDYRRDAQYIFHIGNVGSTLISRLLGELGGVFALREPLLLRKFADRAWPDEMFDVLATLLSRTFRPGQRAIVKATSFTSEMAHRFVPSGSKALFLYASPARYLENILAGENSWQTLQALSPARLERLQSRCPGLAADLARMHDGLRAALGWACEMTSLEATAARMPAGSVLWMDFDTFLADPAARFIAIARHFGLDVEAAAARAICEGPLMRRYSKALDYEYSPELRQEILADARRRHAAPIRDAMNWLAGLESRYPAVAQAIRRAGGQG